MRLILLFNLFFFLFLNQSIAFVYRCEGLFKPNAADYLEPDSEKKILRAIDNYKKIFGLEVLDHKAKSLDIIKQKFTRLSYSQKQELKTLVQKNYKIVTALKYNPNGPFKTFKRHLDLIISESINTPKFFKVRMVDQGLPLEVVLDEYFQIISTWTQAPVIIEGKDVLLTAIHMQYAYFNKKFPQIMALYGSFINGRAFLNTSDLDFSVTNGKIEAIIKESNLVEQLSEFPLSEAQPHIMKVRDFSRLGFLNPLTLIITNNYISVRVSTSTLSTEKPKIDEYYF